MNSNEEIIIFISIIFLPIFLWALIKIPNASKCGSCEQRLNMNRQNTYHSVIENKNIEICKNCYKNKSTYSPRQTQSHQNSQVSSICETSVISKLVEDVNPFTSSGKPQQNMSVIKPSESLSNIEIAENVKLSTRSGSLHQPDSDCDLGESISISEVLKEIRTNNCFWLDTETTGLSSSDEIIELSICTHDKKVVFNSILRSKVPCSPQARAVHGITNEQIANGMPIESAKPALIQLLEGKTIISFNVDFDCKMLFQTMGIKKKKDFV